MRQWIVTVTQIAYDDLVEAATYMSSKLGSPKAAQDFISAFEKEAKNLETLPEARPLVRDLELAKAGYRWAPLGNFMLFYTVDAAGGVVTIERVLYGRRDWQAIL